MRRLRADSGSAMPVMYDACERLGIWYTIGLKLNPVLRRASADLLEAALRRYEQMGVKQRLFCALDY